MEKIPLMDIQKQHAEHASEYEEAVLSVMRSGKYILGDNNKAFEKEFAAYIGVKNAVAVGNGTDALFISLKAYGIQEGDEIITTPFTYFASSECIALSGAKPVFVDINPLTYCLDPEKVEQAITPKTKGILPVHFYGQSCDMDKINEIAVKHHLFVLEDACQAAGTSYNGKKAGNLGTAAGFSFFPTKNLGCDGDGGMITSNDDSFADACRAYRVSGSGINGLKAYNRLHEAQLSQEKDIDISAAKYYHFVVGCNSRLDELQAAILRKKLTHLDDFVERRRTHAARYQEALQGTSYRTPGLQRGGIHSYYLYALYHPQAKFVIKKLAERNIGTGVYYPVPLHLQRALESLKYKKGDFPVTEDASQHTFVIPVYPELNSEQQEYIISSLLEIEKEVSK
jgi:dTDP-4-amino-4,6-dideoxygalactose transaminase